MSENMKEKNSFSFRCGSVKIDRSQLQVFAKEADTSMDRCRRFLAAYVHEMSRADVEGYQDFIDGGDVFLDFRDFCTKINKSAGTIRKSTPEEQELKQLRERAKFLRNKIKNEKVTVSDKKE